MKQHVIHGDSAVVLGHFPDGNLSRLQAFKYLPAGVERVSQFCPTTTGLPRPQWRAEPCRVERTVGGALCVRLP